MPMPRLPHPHLIALRSGVTVALSCLLGQAGWASAFLGGQAQFRPYHVWGAWVTLAVCVANALVYVALRRSAGPVNLTLAVALAAAVGIQVALGETHQVSLHIFVGVLIVMLGTALTSWTYRHTLPDADAPARA
ncbi:hypothetical protein [Propioniciclava soli]|uniref:Uncharacterized protein n=1 Tax=Propioniciclava soli TaxID=2775081 RepID=A0ABZ3C9B7_9ACTN|nr:hypothetical protein [Propioniciclava soli]